MPRNRMNGNRQIQRNSAAYERLKEDGPPQLQTGTVVRSTYRYRSDQAAAIRTISWAELILACGVVAQASGTGVTTSAIARAVRIRRIRAWAAAPIDPNNAPSILNVASVSVDFDVTGTQQYQSALQFVDSTMSNARLAFIDVVPPRGSDAALWHNVSGAGSDAFSLLVSGSGFCDVELEWILADATVALNFTSGAAVVVGQVYYPPLDSSSGTSTYIPVGRTRA
jgi:hypothetical protein